MRTHAVHSEANQRKTLSRIVAPIELIVKMALRLKSTIVSPLQVVEKMLPVRRNKHEVDTILELVADTDYLMLVPGKIIIGIVVPLKKLDEADGFC